MEYQGKQIEMDYSEAVFLMNTKCGYMLCESLKEDAVLANTAVVHCLYTYFQKNKCFKIVSQ